MKRSSNRRQVGGILAMASTLMASGLLMAGASPVQAAAFLPAGVSVLGGANRWGTAVSIADAQYPTGATTAILASGAVTDELDPVLASSLATAVKAPILLTQGLDQIGSTTVAALKHLGVKQVILVGSVTSQASAIRSQLPTGMTIAAQYGDANVFTTAEQLAKALEQATKVKVFPSVFVVSSNLSNLADAIIAAPAAAMQGSPVLLAPTSGSATMPSSEAAYADAAGTLYKIGAATAVAIPGLSSTTAIVPISGTSRSDTALDLDNALVPGTTSVYVVNGENNHLVQALTAAPLIAMHHGALLYVYGSGSSLPSGTSVFLTSSSDTTPVQWLTFIGPPSSIPPNTYFPFEGAFTGIGTGVATMKVTVSTTSPKDDSIVGVAATVTSVAGKAVTTPIAWSIVGANSGDGVIQSTGSDSANLMVDASGTYTISAAVDGTTSTMTIDVAAQ